MSATAPEETHKLVEDTIRSYASLFYGVEVTEIALSVHPVRPEIPVTRIRPTTTLTPSFDKEPDERRYAMT